MTDRAAAATELRHAIRQTAEWLRVRQPGYKAAPARPWSKLEDILYDVLRLFMIGEGVRLVGQVQDHGAAWAVEDGNWWSRHTSGLLSAIRSPLEALARFGATDGRQAIPEPSINVNWGLVNRQAVEWAAEHAAQLVTKVTPTTREAVRQAVAEWAQSGEPLSKLAERIERVDAFGPKRAETIAQTEATTAYAEGNARAWQAAGVQPAAFKPSAHVACRCYLQPWKMPDGTFVMVWYTAHDDIVCTRKIVTPWGDVAGCRELHQTIVSRGPWLGQKRQP